MPKPLPSKFQRFGRREDGAALVEFGVILPLMLVIFALIIESMRVMWSYQAAVAGVRDAARYVSRAELGGACSTDPATLTVTQVTLRNIVENSANGGGVFPGAVTVENVLYTIECVTGDYRNSPVPMADVTAQLTIQLPFSGIFALVGGNFGDIQTNVADRTRIFGQ